MRQGSGSDDGGLVFAITSRFCLDFDDLGRRLCGVGLADLGLRGGAELVGLVVRVAGYFARIFEFKSS